ncbi:cryptochrome DASH [marine bacterium AO1-C]|nr:cryptochrome DASH [marine bacterium AO1-C]
MKEHINTNSTNKHRVKILWFRNNLRLHDNEVLFKAQQLTEHLLPVYCIDPRQFEITELGFPKTGSFRARFLLETLQDLRKNLRSKGSDLIIRVGKPEDEIPFLAAQVKATMVYTSHEIGTEETKVVEAVEQKLWRHQTFLELCWPGNLLETEELPFPLKATPNTFTEFRKNVEKDLPISELYPEPDALPALPAGLVSGEMPCLEQLGLSSEEPDNRAVMPFQGGETAALARLRQYIWSQNLLKNYKETRNGLLGADYSTKFSPWLANGALSVRTIYYEIRKYETEVIKNKSTWHLIFELLWREYFRLIARKYQNEIFLQGGIKGADMSGLSSSRKKTFRRWMNGETGIPFIDANMRELKQTGFMSNRGRQNVASFLTKDLKINWIHGAMYFESQLIDYDVSSNWCNWNYVVGVGNDPREDRYFNILSQAKRYDGKGKYVKHWLPELSNVPENIVHEVGKMKPQEQSQYGVNLGANYPKPIL